MARWLSWTSRVSIQLLAEHARAFSGPGLVCSHVMEMNTTKNTTMNNVEPKRNTFGCSIASLLLATVVCAVLFAIVGGAARISRAGGGGRQTTIDFVTFGAVALLPLCGLLVGHVRFHQIRYMVLGACFGLFIGGVLTAVLAIPEQAVTTLIASTVVPTIGLLVYGVYVRRRQE